ncbi:hypothetical protein [Geodermatophilus sp. CPCC 206100]|uniref:hypothetical protein n=1 Tax=Geodermatophilus sp. CPCC 206100 TaxID=3020054 RepID=UPI003B003843
MTYRQTRRSSSALMVLPTCRGNDLSFALRVEAGPPGGLWLRPEIAGISADWRPEPVVTRWSPADLRLAADWFEEVADADYFPDDHFLWFGSPAVAFGLIEYHPDRIALDVCLTSDPAAPWPTFDGGQCIAAPGTSHRDLVYVTVDLTREACREAAVTWRCWADSHGRVPLITYDDEE